MALLAPRIVVPIHWATYLPVGYARGHWAMRDPGPAFAGHVAELAPRTEVALLEPGGTLEL